MIPTEYLNQITTGDARELSRALPDESVDLIFTDPVYDRMEDYEWLGIMAARVLKDGGSCLAFCGIGWLPDTLTALLVGGLHFRWLLTATYAARHQYHGRLQVCMTTCLWAEKGRAKMYGSVADSTMLPPVRIDRYLQTNGASWDKHPKIVNRYVQGFSPLGGTVYDPFCGTGTIPAHAKTSGRHWLGSEIDPDTAERARERVLLTQPPLPGLLEQQTELELGA